MREILLKLEKAYKNGLVIYPRTDKDYLKGIPFAFYAHPKLESFDKFAVPLKRNTYPLQSETLALYLYNKRVVKSSNVDNICEYVQRRVDIESRKASEEAKKINGVYRDFLERFELNPTIYYQKYFFKPRNIKAYTVKTKKNRDTAEEKKECFKTKVNTKWFDKLHLIQKESFFEALKDYANNAMFYNFLLLNSSNTLTDC